jgi:MarR family transcriptional regulator for hemolysin
VAGRLLNNQLQKGLNASNLDITIEEWRTLFYLWKKDGVNQQELAVVAHKEKSTITRQIDKLEKKGLIIRESAAVDRRNKLIFLTQKGKELEARALAIAGPITEQVEQNVKKEDLVVFKKVLAQFIDTLRDM